MVKKKEEPAVEEMKVEEVDVKEEEVPEAEAPEEKAPVGHPIPPPEAPAPPEPEAPEEPDVPEDPLKELRALEGTPPEGKLPEEKVSKARAPRINYKRLYDGQVRLNAQAAELLTASEGQDLTVRGYIALSAQVKGLIGG